MGEKSRLPRVCSIRDSVEAGDAGPGGGTHREAKLVCGRWRGGLGAGKAGWSRSGWCGRYLGNRDP